MSDKNASSKIALVTGATRGIGAAIASTLAAQGLRVYGTATTESGAQKITQALAPFDGCKGCLLDVTDKEACRALVEQIVKAEGALHILVNNAGITRDAMAVRMKDEDWDAVVSTNLSAVFHLCRAVMRPMMSQQYGRIVNVTSVVGAAGNYGQANYAAAKAGVAGLSRDLALEFASRGITVNCVAPGFIETDMTSVIPEKIREKVLDGIPMKRFGQAQDIAHAVAFLASENASYITGIQLHVNGGKYMTS